MKIGLLGLKNSGKTTIFNALTGLTASVDSFSSNKVEPNLGNVEVYDERITKLSDLYQPQKTIYANIEYIDFVGLTDKEETLPVNLLAMAKTTDAIALVVRNFQNEILDETFGEAEPETDIQRINSELIFSDLVIVEKRLENIILAKKRGIDQQKLKLEEKVLLKIQKALTEEEPIRSIDLTTEEDKAIRGFQFLTKKPIFVILNSDENNFGNNEAILKKIEETFPAIEFAGNFEMELIDLSANEADEFMKDLGINYSARDRLTDFSYQILNYISFFTVGKDEVRAWTLTKGATALAAAARIHSDLARGFIRAECFSFADLMEAGSEKKLREIGKFRLEGKDYIVQDGDIISIRFSV